MAKAQLAFMYIMPDADPGEHRATITKSAFVDLTVVGVSSYEQGTQVARELVSQGVTTIELCGGFGHNGAARIAQAAGDTALVGVVRFDGHPFLGFKSGDTIG
jgi:hypothetical protein